MTATPSSPMSLFEEYDRAASAIWSPCRSYRYVLRRRWQPGPTVNFLMLNPSFATEEINDPTVAGCIARATLLGFGELVVTNLFAFCATDPTVMKAAAFPIGTDNDRHLIDQAIAADLVVCAWGNHGAHMGRSAEVIATLRKNGIALHALRFNKSGEPEHPLYIPRSIRPSKWQLDGTLLSSMI